MSIKGLRSELRELAAYGKAHREVTDDPQYKFWRWWYEIALEVLKDYPEARQKVEQSMGVQEPCFFRPDWRPTATGADIRFEFCNLSLFAALEKFPEAHRALSEFRDQLLAHIETESAATPEQSGADGPSADPNGAADGR